MRNGKLLWLVYICGHSADGILRPEIGKVDCSAIIKFIQLTSIILGSLRTYFCRSLTNSGETVIISILLYGNASVTDSMGWGQYRCVD